MTILYNRHIPLEGTHNMRDLGGYTHDGGGVTIWRALLRADGLHNMTGEAIFELTEMGVAAIIDLRGPHELTTHPNPFFKHATIRYYNIPLFDALAPIAAATTTFDMAARYRDAIDRCGHRIAQVLTAIAEAGEGAVVFHCTAGKDRTGIIAALLLLSAGVAEQVIVEDYALTGLMANTLLLQLRETAIVNGATPEAIDRVLTTDAEAMQQMLRHVETEHGGIEAYLNEIELGRHAVHRLRRRLVG